MERYRAWLLWFSTPEGDAFADRLRDILGEDDALRIAALIQEVLGPPQLEGAVEAFDALEYTAYDGYEDYSSVLVTRESFERLRRALKGARS